MRAKDYIIGQYSIHQNQFIKDDGEPPSYGNILGFVQHKGNKLVIGVEASVFKSWLNAGGFHELKVILSAWKNKNMLDHEPEHLYRRRKLGKGARAHYYCLITEESELSNSNA